MLRAHSLSRDEYRVDSWTFLYVISLAPNMEVVGCPANFPASMGGGFTSRNEVLRGSSISQGSSICSRNHHRFSMCAKLSISLRFSGFICKERGNTYD